MFHTKHQAERTLVRTLAESIGKPPDHSAIFLPSAGMQCDVSVKPTAPIISISVFRLSCAMVYCTSIQSDRVI